MARTTINELTKRRLDAITVKERAVFDETYEAARLALEVGDHVRDARKNAGLSQGEFAARMGTSQAAVARLEAGGVGATLTTRQKIASALALKITIELTAAS
jgi:ribosome-binding protein aMBF1 (putative translation factor)